MVFSYGEGIFYEGQQQFQGEIVLSEHKLYLRNAQGDIPQTYIPLEKIMKVARRQGKAVFYVCPSVSFQYVAFIGGQPSYIKDLIKDVVQRRGLKKQFWRAVWIEEV